MKIIQKNGQVYLYRKLKNYTRLVVMLLKNGEIKTYWLALNPNKERLRTKKRFKENKQILHRLKINGCTICGYNECDAALDFHHTNPKDKEFLIIPYNIERKDFVKEINKCILLCSNCHRELHSKERKII